MKRTVIYARYSSNNQREESIEGQIRVCAEYAKAKGLRVVGEYIDRAVSGRTDNRPDFQRLMRDCNRKMFDAVIVYATDRFARNKYDSAIYKRQLKKANVELHYATEHIPEGPEGIILESLMEGLAEYYSARLSENIKRGIHESAQKALAVGGSKVLGYKLAPDKSFEINEKEAEAVRIIFEMFVREKTNSEICEHLNSRGIKTSRGNSFTKAAIPRIIKNEKYIGVYDCAGFRFENAIPAIISKEVFQMAQLEVAKRRRSKQAHAPRVKYLLSGKLFCGHCKKKMVGVSGTGGTGKKFYYYYCPDNRGRVKNCGKKHVTKNWLEDLVVEQTLAHVLQPDTIKHIADKCYEIQLRDKAGEEEIDFFQQRVSENKKALANIMQIIETGVVTDTLPMRLKELELERAELQASLQLAESSKALLKPDHIEYLLKQFMDKGEDEEVYKKNIIDCFVTSVYLYDNRLLIHYNISKTEPRLDSSELDILEAGPFDQRGDSCRYLKTSFTESTLSHSLYWF